MAIHNQFGKNGEALAKAYLEQAGYQVLEQNWRFGRAEVDLIAYDKDILVFVEVKTRSKNFFGEPEDFVDRKKQVQLCKAADEYIYRIKHQKDIRFDILSVLLNNNRQPEIKHIRDAFWPQHDSDT